MPKDELFVNSEKTEFIIVGIIVGKRQQLKR